MVIVQEKGAYTCKKGGMPMNIVQLSAEDREKFINKLKTGMSILLIIGTTATLFGLLGTAWGMSSAFKNVSLHLSF